MKNKKGFTLIELLAVIVVLAIIMVIAGSNLIGTKREANIAEAKKIEKMIEDLGPGIYSFESISGNKNNSTYFYKAYKGLNPDDSIYVSFSELKNAGYLKSGTIKNPSGNGNCDGYLEVKKTDDGPEFYGRIDCDIYKTNSYDDSYAASSSVYLTY